jgi:hypothetical protein
MIHIEATGISPIAPTYPTTANAESILAQLIATATWQNSLFDDAQRHLTARAMNAQRVLYLV